MEGRLYARIIPVSVRPELPPGELSYRKCSGAHLKLGPDIIPDEIPGEIRNGKAGFVREDHVAGN